MSRPIVQAALAVSLTLFLAACGSSPKKPSTEIAMTSAALQSAETAGARDYAPIELRRAREKQALANKKLDKEEYEAARRYSEQAIVDAELAKAKSEAEKSRLALKEVQDGIQLMRQEVGRANGQ